MGFFGYSSRINPTALPAGIAQLSENMRLDRAVATTRKGAKRMANDIAPASTPLTVPFILSPSPSEPVVQSSYEGGIFASYTVRSPDAVNSYEVIVLVGRDRAYLVQIDDGSAFSPSWGSGAIIETTDNEEIITDTGDTIISANLPSELTFPSTPDELVELTDAVSLVQAFNRLYLFREADSGRLGWETKTIDTSGIVVTGTTAKVHCPAHGLPLGARVRIENGDVTAFNGHEYDIINADPNSDGNYFSVTVPSGTATTTISGMTARRVKPPLYWDLDPNTDFVRSPAGIPTGLPATYKTLRSTGWATYVNGRLIVPDGRDNVLISDAFDPNTYDPFFSSFRANQGSNDYLVAVQPWVDGSFLVFMRKSIWLAQVEQTFSTDGSAAAVSTPISRLELLTDEVGCSARQSIAVAGNFVFFLSDAGVYRLDSQLDLKLRGNTKPLSDGIADQMGEINAAYAYKAVGLWHDNRYMLAVAYGDATNNNSLFIWSALNDQWETRDLYAFGVDNLLVATYQRERRVFTTSQAGILMLLNEQEAGDDAPNSAVTNYVGTVSGRLITRRYAMGTMTNKRYLRSVCDVVLPDTATLTIRALMTNPDETITLIPSQTNGSGVSEDYTLKNPIRYKANFCDLEFITTAHRPEIRSVSIEAALPAEQPTLTRNQA